MKKAQKFYDQMTQEEKDEFFREFKFQRPHLKLTEWLEENEFPTFERFLDNAFDHRRLISGTNRIKFTYWFEVMIKYNISNPFRE